MALASSAGTEKNLRKRQIYNSQLMGNSTYRSIKSTDIPFNEMGAFEANLTMLATSGKSLRSTYTALTVTSRVIKPVNIQTVLGDF